MPSVSFARESITDALLAEAMPLLRQHWHEVAQYDDIPLAVDTTAYLAAGESGVARCYTVRASANAVVLYDGPMRRRLADAGQLLGYALFFVRPAPHYAGSLQAAQDVIYLDPALRGGTGAEFIAWCDEQLRADGVQVVHHHQKNAHPALGKVLARLGYSPVETVWSRRLDTVKPAPTWDDVRALANVTTDDLVMDATAAPDLLAFSTLMHSLEMSVVEGE